MCVDVHDRKRDVIRANDRESDAVIAAQDNWKSFLGEDFFHSFGDFCLSLNGDSGINQHV